MELVTMHRAQRLEAPLTLPDLAKRLRTEAASNEDHSGITLGATTVQPDGMWRYNGQSGLLSRHALSQLCARIRLPGGGTVPASYIARCPGPLAAEHLNHWLSQPEMQEQRVLVRTRSNGLYPTVRAVLSDRYAVLDHLPVVEALSEVTDKHQLNVSGWSLDDTQLTLRLILNADHPVSLQDPLRVGLHISNSEVGLGKVSIAGLITRLVCTNGLIVRVGDLGGLHRRHIGRAGESLSDIVHEGLPAILNEADEAARRFVHLREVPAPQPLEDFLQRTAEAAELPEEMVPRLAGLMEGDTLYDVVNAFTLIAQRLSVSERLQLETTMSAFLRDDRNWN